MASADATKLGARGVIPTYHTMDAGTLARALAAAAGRKGGRKTAQMCSDFHNPAITQPKKTADKAKKIMGGTGGHTVGAHTKACVAGGGSPTGGYDTAQATDAHKAASVAGGGCPPGGFDTAQALDAHKAACVAGGGCPVGGFDTAQATDAHTEASAAGGGCPAGGYIDLAEKQKHVDRCMEGKTNSMIQMGRACAAREKGLKTMRTVIVHDGVEVEFFQFCEESRVSRINCSELLLTPSHGRLYKAMAKREDQTTDICLSLPLTNGTNTAGLVAVTCKNREKSKDRGFAGKRTIKRLEDNNVTWSTAEFLVTDKVVEDFKAAKAITAVTAVKRRAKATKATKPEKSKRRRKSKK